jgi:hypothetical protein
VSRAGFRGDLDPRFCPGGRRFSGDGIYYEAVPEELRERAVRLVFESGRPVAHVAKTLQRIWTGERSEAART